jgi:hypothetical protein
MVPSTITITLRAEPELPLRAQERPVLPPSAMVPTPRLALSDSQLNCLSQGGGDVTHPQWVTINPWTGPNDYRLVEGLVVSAWPSKGTAFRCGVSGCSTAGACRLTPRFIRQSAGLCIATGPCAFPTARRSRLIWRRTWSPPPRATIFTCRASSVICGSTRIPGAPLAEMRAVSRNRLTNWGAVSGDVTTLSNRAAKPDVRTSSNRFYRVRVLP